MHIIYKITNTYQLQTIMRITLCFYIIQYITRYQRVVGSNVRVKAIGTMSNVELNIDVLLSFREAL